MSRGLREAVLLTAAGAVIGFGANAAREASLPMTGELGPPPVPEAGAGLEGSSVDAALAADAPLSELVPLHFHEGAPDR